jgi:glycerol-3-phosphate dehydrogenase (NAD(P)+)
MNSPGSRYHERARTKGVNPIVYWLTRALLQPFAHIYWRLSRIGREHIPASGPVIFVSNHRSFADPFILGFCCRRPVYYVAKQELFGYNRLLAWWISNLGAFPVRRGEGDADFVETAKAILERGDPLLIFPEGTRTRPGALGKPKRGVGRLALETGATVVPVAMIGTENIRRGFKIRPVKVRVRIGAPLTFPHVETATSQLATAVTDRIWPNVMLQWEWLGGMPPLRRAAVIGDQQLSDTLVKAGIEVDRNPATLTPDQHDMVVFAVPAGELPELVARYEIAPKTNVLVLSQGLVPPLGALPSGYVAEHTGARAVGILGELEGGRTVVASADKAFARLLASALVAAGVRTGQTGDIVGVELAALAAEAAALAPDQHAAAAVVKEIETYARRRGSKAETFERAAASAPGDAAVIPLLAAQLRQAGIDAPALDRLAKKAEHAKAA